eukprot:13473062-Alexandrium_andersonii.AAC.1
MAPSVRRRRYSAGARYRGDQRPTVQHNVLSSTSARLGAALSSFLRAPAWAAAFLGHSTLRWG